MTDRNNNEFKQINSCRDCTESSVKNGMYKCNISGDLRYQMISCPQKKW